MWLIYIAGPYRSDTENGVRENINRAAEVALKYWKAGFAVICPHMNSAFFGGACPDETWLNGGIEMLRRCDGLVLIRGWEDSEGSVSEYRFANVNNIPLVFDNCQNAANSPDALRAAILEKEHSR